VKEPGSRHGVAVSMPRTASATQGGPACACVWRQWPGAEGSKDVQQRKSGLTWYLKADLMPGRRSLSIA